ncbi:MAG TPA: hypothetical protein VL309_07945 [Vicinamibacterales bacterium]|nr:hypothetical protein [Vicinamibacterales bacterium]
MTATALRALSLVVRPSRELAAFALVVAGCAVFDALRRPQLFGECYALALLFQMFSASTGFREPARRGHFDAMLVSAPRVALAWAHLGISIAAGVAVWLGTSAIDAALVRHGPRPGLQAPALVGLVVVSLVAWTIGLALPRYAGGALWLAAIVVVAGSGYTSFIKSALFGPYTLGGTLEQTAGLLVVPMLLAGPPHPPPLVVQGLALAAAGACAWLGVQYIRRFDARLEASS